MCDYQFYQCQSTVLYIINYTSTCTQQSKTNGPQSNGLNILTKPDPEIGTKKNAVLVLNQSL